jgi:hypothetical protein
MMAEGVGARFGSTDERTNYRGIPERQWRRFPGHRDARPSHELGIKPVHTPMNSPQPNGMAETS